MVVHGRQGVRERVLALVVCLVLITIAAAPASSTLSLSLTKFQRSQKTLNETITIGESEAVRSASSNVEGGPLQLCSEKPLTGYFRNGFCETGPSDKGTHTVCAVVDDTFLRFTEERGNDLRSPRPEYQFPGLVSGDRWCLCVLRWKEAYHAGIRVKVITEASHIKSLDFVSLETLRESSG